MLCRNCCNELTNKVTFMNTVESFLLYMDYQNFAELFT